jgi:hypothetical protein
MDSVHKLIEMLEQRFGKLPADGLLLLSVLGAAAWGLNTFMADFVLPVAHALAAVWIAIAAMKPIKILFPVELFTEIGVAAVAACVLGMMSRSVMRSRARLQKSLESVRESLARLEFDKRSALQERDALEYFIEHSGGSNIGLPPKRTEERWPPDVAPAP